MLHHFVLVVSTAYAGWEVEKVEGNLGGDGEEEKE